jgi:hypothetical protein
MRCRRIISLTAGLICLLVSVTAPAHHGNAAYSTEEITLQATVTKFRFVNPHVLIYFDITTEEGELQHWQSELTAPNRLARGGWTKTSFKPGDKVEISGRAAKNNGHSVRINKMVLPDGEIVPLWEIFD